MDLNDKKLTELIDLHYGSDKAVVRFNIRTIAIEYAKFVKSKPSFKDKKEKLTELIDLHYGSDKAAVRFNIRTIAVEYSNFLMESKINGKEVLLATVVNYHELIDGTNVVLFKEKFDNKSSTVTVKNRHTGIPFLVKKTQLSFKK